MPRKDSRNTKMKIVNAAWELFYKNGFENTTVEDIVFESSTSKGSFYHYFDGKEELLSSLSSLFDSRYEELEENLTDEMSCFDKLMFLNKKLFIMVENSIPIDLLARLYSSQLTMKGDRNLLDHNRTYYKLLRKIVVEGQEKGELRDDVSVNEIVKAYALCERAIISDWCLCNGEYSLARYSETLLPLLFGGFLKKI
ncbi:MAG: helix-turn-helix domain-containing protein [Acutalibacteraceae bacterium]|nr:helix-turn-helix domain-containing protein [Acutalibacteraceae bacterium]